MRGLPWLLVLGCVGCGGAVVRVDLPEGGAGAKPAGQAQSPSGKGEKKAAAQSGDKGKDDPTKKPDPFALPSDDAGKLLAKAVAPRPLPARLDGPKRPPPPTLPVPDALLPPVLVPDAPPLVPQLARTPGGEMRPRFAQPEGLGTTSPRLALPERAPFAAQLTRVESADVTIPPPLPVTATALPDRVPLDDPTAALSIEAALTEAMPSRSTPAPYLRMTLAAPFEHRRPLTLPLPAEATAPQVEAPRAPGK